MQIAILGAGNVGSPLAGAMTRAGPSVTLSAADPEHARAAAAKTGAHAAASNREAVRGAEIVVLAVPYPTVPQVLADLGTALDGSILLDVTNRLDMGNLAGTLGNTSAAEEIQRLAPNARVVKAFNYAFAARQADPVLDGISLDGFVAGDDVQAKAKVLELVGSVGFRPVDSGSLAMARALEALAVLNIALQLQHGWPWQSGWKLLGPTG
jgi:NADPH-dependent F420 reductase